MSASCTVVCSTHGSVLRVLTPNCTHESRQQQSDGRCEQVPVAQRHCPACHSAIQVASLYRCPHLRRVDVGLFHIPATGSSTKLKMGGCGLQNCLGDVVKKTGATCWRCTALLTLPHERRWRPPFCGPVSITAWNFRGCATNFQAGSDPKTHGVLVLRFVFGAFHRASRLTGHNGKKRGSLSHSRTHIDTDVALDATARLPVGQHIEQCRLRPTYAQGSGACSRSFSVSGNRVVVPA